MLPVMTVLAAFALVFIFIEPLYIQLGREKKRLAADAIKPVGVLIAAGFAAAGAAKIGGAAWLIPAGLLVCAVADVLLEHRFVLGMAAFGFGHILYILHFAMTSGVKLSALLLLAAVVGLLIPFVLKHGKKMNVPIPAIIAYGTLLTSSMAFCVTAPLSMGEMWMKALPFAFGGLLFLVSDLMLFCSICGVKLKFSNVMGTYYGAQLMLAMGVYLPACVFTV